MQVGVEFRAQPHQPVQADADKGERRDEIQQAAEQVKDDHRRAQQQDERRHRDAGEIVAENDRRAGALRAGAEHVHDVGERPGAQQIEAFDASVKSIATAVGAQIGR